MLTGCANQPMIEALDDEPLHHAVMGACRDIILQMLPCLDNGFIRELLKVEILFQWALVLPNGKNLVRNGLEHFSQVDTASLLE
jgi:hypothetical protein